MLDDENADASGDGQSDGSAQPLGESLLVPPVEFSIEAGPYAGAYSVAIWRIDTPAVPAAPHLELVQGTIQVTPASEVILDGVAASTQIEIAISTDVDNFADPAFSKVIAASDRAETLVTEIVGDGETYFARQREYNDNGWGAWSEASVGLKTEPEPNDAVLLTWAPPALSNPAVITLPKGDYNSSNYDTATDIEVKPFGGVRDQPCQIWGGRNVVMIGGSHQPTGRGAYNIMSAIRVRDVADDCTIFFEGQDIDASLVSEGLDGIHAGGGAHYTTAIPGSNPRANLYIQNCRLSGIRGTAAENHSNVFRHVYGLRNLRVDRVDADSNFQGFFLRQLDLGGKINSFGGGVVDLRNTYFRRNQIEPHDDADDLAFLLFAGNESEFNTLFSEGHLQRIRLTNVWCEVLSGDSPRNVIRPTSSTAVGSDSISEYVYWPDHPGLVVDKDNQPAKVRIGTPPGGTMLVQGVHQPGHEYVSPGYGAT